MQYPASEYVRVAQKYANFVAKAIIFPAEYAQNLLSSAALYEVDAATAREVASSVPVEARSELEKEILVVLAPGYQVPPLAFGGSGPSEAERERIRIEHTQRIRAFAAHLARELSDRT